MGVTRHPLGSINGRNPAYRSHRRLSGAYFTRVESVRLNLWNFGGQDIYHGSHALFLHGRAIFLVLWTPALERQTTYQEGELSLHPIGVGRVAVRDRMRPMLAEDQERESAQRQHRLRERAEFDRICDEIGGVSDKNAMEQHFKDLGSPTSGSTRRCRNGTTGSAICSPM
jgi:hypothetical protein